MLRPKNSSAKNLFDPDCLRVPLDGHRPDLPLVRLARNSRQIDIFVKVDDREAIRRQRIPGPSNMFPQDHSSETFVVFARLGRPKAGDMDPLVARL